MKPETAILPDGFKMTELGPLPEEWQVVRLGEVATFYTGKREKGGASSTGEVFSVGGEHITEDGRIDFSNPKYVSKAFFIQMRSGVVKRGDVLLCKDGAKTGKSAFVEQLPEEGLAVNEHVFIVRSQNEAVLFPRFLGYWFMTKKAWEQIRKAYHGLIGGINREEIGEFIVTLPPLPEQRAIAHVLRTVQEAKEAAERVIQAARELKKSLMQHLFTYGPAPLDHADRVPLQETEIGPIPQHWQVVRLGNGYKIFSGFAFKSKDFAKTGLPVVKIGNLVNGTLVADKNASCYPSNLFSINLCRYLLNEGDILIALTGATTGKVARVPKSFEGALLNQRVGKIELLNVNEFHGDYAYWLIQTAYFQSEIREKILKSAQGNISPKVIENIPVPKPPLPEQQEIARILQAVDEKIAAEERRKGALEALFQTFLHHLMTGKVRVAPELAEVKV